MSNILSLIAGLIANTSLAGFIPDAARGYVLQLLENDGQAKSTEFGIM